MGKLSDFRFSSLAAGRTEADIVRFRLFERDGEGSRIGRIRPNDYV